MHLVIGDIQIPFQNLGELRGLLDALSPVQPSTHARHKKRKGKATATKVAPVLAKATVAKTSQGKSNKPKGASPVVKKPKAKIMELPYVEAKLTWEEVEKVGKAIGRTDKFQLRSELRERQRLEKAAQKKAKKAS
jgi:hypothetical protein